MNRLGGCFWGFFIIGIFILIGGVFTGIAGFQLKEYFDSGEWPAAEGNITQLSIDQDYDSDSGYTYRANVEYVFTVNGLDYYGNRYQFGADIWSSDRGRAEAIIDAYDVNDDVLVYYNPSDPNANVLLREVDWLLWLFLGVGVILLLVGFVIALSSAFGSVRGARKPKDEAFQSGDYLLENEKFKL